MTVDRTAEVYNSINDALMDVQANKSEAVEALLTALATQMKGSMLSTDEMQRFVGEMSQRALLCLAQPNGVRH